MTTTQTQTQTQTSEPSFQDVREMLRLEGQLQRATNGLTSIDRRMGNGSLTGRNAAATRRAIDNHLAKGNEAVRAIVDSPLYTEQKYTGPICRFWQAERRALGI
jgi:hypothetical protein